MKTDVWKEQLSPTQLRLAASVDSAIRRFLELFESDDMRLKATQILANMIVARFGPDHGENE